MADDTLKSVHIEQMNPSDLVLLERNAHYMTDQKFQRLVANIRRDGCLTSTPLAVRMADGRYEVRSGNHRTRASIAAGLDSIWVMCVDDELEYERLLAMQMSHNSVVGEDDPALLKEIYEEVDDVDWREYAGLDDATLDLMDHVQPVSLNEATLRYQSITLVFLPHEVPDVRDAFDLAREQIDTSGETWLVSMAEYDGLMDSLAAVGGAHDITNQALAMKLLLGIATDHMTDLVDGWWDEHEAKPIRPRQWVPLVSIFGGGEIPVDAAAIVHQAVQKMRDVGDISEKSLWQALELWAADYLAGADDG